MQVPLLLPQEWSLVLLAAQAVLITIAAADNGWERAILLAWMGHRVWGGAVVEGPTPKLPDGGRGPLDEVGTGAGDGIGRPALGDL